MNSASYDTAVSREQIIENMERRKKQLELMLQEAKDKIEDHYSGRALLESEEKEKLEKRNEIIERKLERMQDLDEREIDRMQEREARRWERRRSRGREL
eukprot:CAMPEP_0202454234 /NCGR_PEP_ID=MMETSP1360-20130828/12027_1 /ASSEMBLY_ACC=CAM_ASM_000848 /TAXON_ID=515479 /ORGANISM="Licmophora paradoxa, Strain CCMP2313" /LENGTH=98 /DNA_ID=CAMNT_0049073513 /DNA_START=131 /DNA_END=427 /DNA_ORIENTATION=-